MTEAQARTAGWFRFTQVKQFVPDGQVLYRSSAPNFEKLPSGDHDASQNLTQDSVKFLSDLKIDSIISFNKYAYRPDQLAKLENATPKIAYLHLPVYDGSAPNLGQLRKACDFFLGKKSTLVHAGYGLGRTATGFTALQIATVFGQALEPYASTWWGTKGNQVEKRRQISALAELRNVLLQNKIRDVADIGPKKSYAIINAATGYYLTISQDNETVIALSPETVEHGPRTRPQYLWTIVNKDKEFRLSNRVTYESFANTKLKGPAVGDLVKNGPENGAEILPTQPEVVPEPVNVLFTITETETETETEGTDRGLYVISRKKLDAGDPDLVVSIREPDDTLKRLYYTKQVPVVLSDKDKIGKFGQWIILPILNA